MTINKQALREIALAAKTAPEWYPVGEYGDVVDPAKPEWRPVADFCKTFTPEMFLALLDELEAAERRNSEQAGTIAKQEKWISGIEESMIFATDRAEAAEKRIAELEAKLQTADNLHDSGFRHGLQHGFSFGQTDNQAGFEECLSAYGSRGKDNG